MSNWHDRHRTPYDLEHEREYRKHDTPPLCVQSPPIAGALEIAILVKGLKNVTEAATLIEQYAQTVAAEARLQAVADTGERIISAIDAHGAAHAKA